LIDPKACQQDTLIEECPTKRGNVFDKGQSASWHQMDARDWDPTETSYRAPRHHGNTTFRAAESIHTMVRSRANNYGTDQISGDGWTIPDQGIMSMSAMYPFVGRLGLFTHYGGGAKDPISLFDNIRVLHHLKSASWSYTAGVKHGKQTLDSISAVLTVADNIPASLVFGGLDISRFNSKSTLTMIQTRSHNRLEVGLRGIVVDGENLTHHHGGQGPNIINLGKTTAELDFSRSHIELPDGVCKILSEDLGIEYDQKTGLYLIDDDKHEELTKAKTTISFILSGSQGGQRHFPIPYKSLVVEGLPPNVAKPTRYLAIQKSGDRRYNFGRIFFQHVYMTAEFNRPGGAHVYLSHAKHVHGTAPQIKELNPNRFNKPSANDKLGIILPIVFVCASMLLVLVYILWARFKGIYPFRRTAVAAAPVVQKPTELEDAAEWPADRKMRMEEGEETEVLDVPVYQPRMRAQGGEHTDNGEGSSMPPPRYSMALAEGADPKHVGKATVTEVPARDV
jgi:hypothetical protein